MTDPQQPSPYGPPAQAGPPQPPYQPAPQIPDAPAGWYGQPRSPHLQAQPYGSVPLAPRMNPLAIVSLCASSSIVVLWVLLLILPAIGLLPGVAGVVTGHIALAQITRTGERGRGLAITGLAVGYATVGLLLLGFVAMIAFFAVVGFGGAISY